MGIDSNDKKYLTLKVGNQKEQKWKVYSEYGIALSAAIKCE